MVHYIPNTINDVMKKFIPIIVFLVLPQTVFGQVSSDEQIQKQIENLSNAEHVNITLAWIYRSLLSADLIDEIISMQITDIGPTVRLSVVKNREFSHIVKLISEWIKANEQISVAQAWTSYDGVNVLLVRSNDPIDLLIGFTYHIEPHHLILFAGENLMGL